MGSLLIVNIIRLCFAVAGLDTRFYRKRMIYRDLSLKPMTIAQDLGQVGLTRLSGG